MSQTDALKRYLEAGMAFTQLTRKRAEQVVKDLVAAGDLQRNQAKEAIDELVERSRSNTDALAEQVRKEVDSHLSNMGLARKADIEKLEAEVQRLRASGAEVPVRPAATAKAAPTKKAAPAKKAPAQKAPAKKAGSDTVPVSGELPAKRVAKAAKKPG